MTVLWWLIPAAVATLVAVAWAGWSGRARPRADAERTRRDFQRFQAAMQDRGAPPGRQRRRRR